MSNHSKNYDPCKQEYFTPNENMATTRSMFGLNYVPKRPNVWVFSLDNPNMAYVKDSLVDEGQFSPFVETEIPVKKRFNNWIMENYQEILTQKQLTYLQDILDGKSDKYSRQDRYLWRKRIQKFLMKGYFNMENMQYYRRLEYDLEKLNICRKLRRKASNNQDFVYYILDNLDTNYINELVYGNRISSECFKALIQARLSRDTEKPYIPNSTILNEIYEIVIRELEETKQIIISHQA